MKITLATLAAVLMGPWPAIADTYTCMSVELCVCQKADGCSGIDAYLEEKPTEICGKSSDIFKATTHRRKIHLDGDSLKLTLKEARPYFSDLDWYQAGATHDRWLVNLRFDNESIQTRFDLRQMARGSVNEHEWVLTGTCEVVE
ncbi:hypothetical protein KUV51_05870 [Tateyamaria omphalii]|uniref:hypothetical protein n=1 Tax=Tateyamaria omphalii TaxID=299262 RepID=UPI001C99890F|nr:hypothetical protein [Tateyamaria omphalii]MBY5932520.1 hypothetical protein [Tateyamaria omphalii]